MVCVLLVGCGRSGQLTVQSVHDVQVARGGAFDEGVYGFADDNHLHVMLTEGPIDEPATALHLSMFWRPRAGRTAMDERGTNVVVRYVVFEGDQVGVYGGGGFLWTGRGLGATLTADVRQALMNLQDRSDGFVDELGLAGASGVFTARRDDGEALRRVRALQRRVSAALGYPRFVQLRRKSQSSRGRTL
ncbi:MAG: hypothetical protein CMJ49_12695 [Planctomycetaceae bacterium]|nr:hypothetical protein [Planctomycetaceae bacterium]